MDKLMVNNLSTSPNEIASKLEGYGIFNSILKSQSGLPPVQ